MLRRLGRQRRLAEAHAVLCRQQAAEVRRRRAVAARVEHPRKQLLGSRLGLDVELLFLLAEQHQARLQLKQRRDQHDEFGRRLELELAARFEVVEVCEHDLGELQLEQVDLFAQHQREQQVERAREEVEIQLEIGEGHGCQGTERSRRGAPTPIRSRTSASVPAAIAPARAAPSARIASSARSSARSSA